MKEKILRRYAFFLLVLLLVQDFAHLKYVSRPLKLRRIQDEQIENEEDRETRAISTKDVGKSRQRRWVTTVLIGLSLFASLVSVTAEIILAIEGCCLTTNACEYQEEFEETKSEIEAENELIDQMWEESQIKLIWIERTNVLNERLWNEVDRITNAFEQLIFGISPQLEIEMTKYNNELMALVESGNETVQEWSASELNANYPTYFTGEYAWIPIVSYVSTFLSSGGKIIFDVARKRTRARELIKFVDTTENLLKNIKNQPSAWKLLGSGDPKVLLREAKAATIAATKHKTTFEWIKKGAWGLLSVGLVGVEIWQTIEKFKKCDNISTTLKNARDAIRQDLVNITAIKEEVTNYTNSLDVTYIEYVKDQLTQVGVLDYLRDVKNLSEQASSATSLQPSIEYIDTFLNTIESADKNETYELVNGLITALEQVQFTVDCLKLKTDTVNAIHTRCKEGTNTLKELYDSEVAAWGTNTGLCTTEAKIPYTSFEDINTTITMYAEVENFSADCRLNDPKLPDDICNEVCQGFDDDKIAASNSITVAQVAELKEKCSAACPLTPQDEEGICNFKKFVSLADMIVAMVPPFGEADVTAVYNACP